MDELIAAARAVIANAKGMQPYPFAEVVPNAPIRADGIRPSRQVWRVEHAPMVDLAAALAALTGSVEVPS